MSNSFLLSSAQGTARNVLVTSRRSLARQNYFFEETFARNIFPGNFFLEQLFRAGMYPGLTVLPDLPLATPSAPTLARSSNASALTLSSVELKCTVAEQVNEEELRWTFSGTGSSCCRRKTFRAKSKTEFPFLKVVLSFLTFLFLQSFHLCFNFHVSSAIFVFGDPLAPPPAGYTTAEERGRRRKVVETASSLEIAW